MSKHALVDHRPSVDEIEAIARRSDAALRNLHITQCYHELSHALAQRLGGANWCTFATWASKQAGQTIRKEDLKRKLKELEASSVTAQGAEDVAGSTQAYGAKNKAADIQALLWEILNPGAALERASLAVARGNQKVFEEIGREFARFLAQCSHDAACDPENLARFCAELRPGDPPEGQQYLRQAFRRYYRAWFENEGKARAELLLLANLEVGFHEQTRLQPEIAAALEAALVDSKDATFRLLRALFPYHGWLIYLFFLAMRLLGSPTGFDRALHKLVSGMRRRIRMFLTEHMMAIAFPHVRLRLGEDLRAEFPAALQRLASVDLQALLQQIDLTPDSVHETGTQDWADLRERLHFIADLFRCYQECAELFEPPFTLEQTAALKAGRLPGGDL